MDTRASMYKRHRFPPEIIQHVVWLYHRFNLSSRDIEDLMAERGIAISYESIRLWCIKFGPKYARRLRRRHQGYGDTFYLDEVFVRIQGVQHYLAQSTRMVKWLMCSYSAADTERRQSVSSNAYYGRAAMNRDELSQISFGATVSLIEKLSRIQSTTPPNSPTIEQSFRISQRESESAV